MINCGTAGYARTLNRYTSLVQEYMFSQTEHAASVGLLIQGWRNNSGRALDTVML